MRWNVLVSGDDYVYVNGGHKVHLDTFIQTMKDENQRLKMHKVGYNDE